MIETEAKPASDLPPAAEAEPKPKSAVAGSLDELGELVQEVSDVARALARLALAETALSALALRRVVFLRLLLMVAVVLAVVFLGGAGLIALANLLESTAAAFAIYGVVFLALAAFAAARAKAWRSRIGYAETRAAIRESFQKGPDDAP